jgi:hypothetical protein
VESGAIPDSDIFSLEFWRDHQFAYNGRLNSPYPHCCKRNDDMTFYVDLKSLHWIVAVAIQGSSKDGFSGIFKFSVGTRLSFVEYGTTDDDNQFTVCALCGIAVVIASL